MKVTGNIVVTVPSKVRIGRVSYEWCGYCGRETVLRGKRKPHRRGCPMIRFLRYTKPERE